MVLNTSSFKAMKKRSSRSASEWLSKPKSRCPQWSEFSGLIARRNLSKEVGWVNAVPTMKQCREVPPAKIDRGTPLQEHLDRVLDLLASSRQLLELKADWDENGSPPIDKGTFKRAFDFLFGLVRYSYSATGRLIELPAVTPGPNGGIDLLWKIGQSKLLLNIPHSGSLVGYYGYNAEGEEMKGRIQSDGTGFARALAIWLSQR